MALVDYEKLDPGIRNTVRWLREQGFETTDSGDGVSKLGGIIYPESDVLPYPHVFIRVAPDKMVLMADRLLLELQAEGVVFDPCKEKSPLIEASYSPLDGYAVIALLYVNDETLKEGQLSLVPGRGNHLVD